MIKLEIFKEISIGGLTKEQLIQRLAEVGIQFNKYAYTLFEHSAFSPGDQAQRVKLVKVNLSSLGLSSPCSFQEILNRASDVGLMQCPLYLGAFLRLEHIDQPEGPYLTIASAKPKIEENYPTGFYIRN